jgi:PLAT/LH2 domain
VQPITRLALTLTVAATALLTPVAHADRYTVYVQTGTADATDPRKADGPGTDARVSIRLHGTQGATLSIPLSTGRVTDFDAGNVDVFTFEAPHVGQVSGIEIGHDNTGIAPDWFLEWVVVTNTTTGTVGYFPYHGWLAGDNLLSTAGLTVTLTAKPQESATSR